jgi:hypothetical protein
LIFTIIAHVAPLVRCAYVTLLFLHEKADTRVEIRQLTDLPIDQSQSVGAIRSVGLAQGNSKAQLLGVS